MAYDLIILVMTLTGAAMVIVSSYRMSKSKVFAVGIVTKLRTPSDGPITESVSAPGVQDEHARKAKSKAILIAKSAAEQRTWRCSVCGQVQVDDRGSGTLQCKYCGADRVEMYKSETEPCDTKDEAIQEELRRHRTLVHDLDKRIRRLEMKSVREFEEVDESDKTRKADTVH